MSAKGDKINGEHYLSDVEDEEEDPKEDPEEEPIEQLVPEPKYMDGFALYPNLQQEGNINGWLIEDDDEQEEVEEMDDEEMDDEEMEVDDDDDSDEEYEFVPPSIPVVDANLEPIPPIVQFGGNFHVGESSSTRALLAGNGWVHAPEAPSECPTGPTFVPRSDDPYAIIRDAATATARGDDGDDITASRDPQPSEPHGSPNKRRNPLEFQVKDMVMLKVSPWRGVIRFGKQRKLNPRYIRHFKILAKVGIVAYFLEMLEQLSRVHSTFHVSNLKKCLSDETLVISFDEIQIDDKLHFVKEPVEIMDREVKRLKQSRSIKFVGTQKEVPSSPGNVKTSFKRNTHICFQNP
nr:putative reverse transcriptase domain-containing protein [Tanacetum cinerariifolium]